MQYNLHKKNTITAQSIAILKIPDYTDRIARITNENQFDKINTDTTDSLLNNLLVISKFESLYGGTCYCFLQMFVRMYSLFAHKTTKTA
jgi:hypothetical protein